MRLERAWLISPSEALPRGKASYVAGEYIGTRGCPTGPLLCGKVLRDLSG